MSISDNLVFLNRGNGTTFLDVENGDAAGTNVNTPVAVVGDDSEDGMTYNGSSNYTSMQTLSSYSFFTGAWTIAGRATSTSASSNDAFISFGANSGNAWRLWLGFQGSNTIRARVRTGSFVEIDINGTATIDSTERVYVLRGRDKLDDSDFSNGIIELIDNTGSVVASADYDLTILTGFQKHTVGGDVTSSFSGGIIGDMFWSAGWDVALSTAEIQSLDDSAFPFAAVPTITDVNTTNIVQVDDTPTVTGTAFLATAGSQTWNAESVGVDTWSDTQIVCEAITRGDKAYDTNYDWVVTDNLAVDSAAFSVQLAIETGFQFVELLNPINALVGGFRTSLCVGSSPACATGDQLRVPTTTDQGKALDISAADGTFVITGAGDTLQTFDFEIWDANGDTGDKWSLSTAAVINGVIVSGGIVTPIVSNIVRSIVH